MSNHGGARPGAGRKPKLEKFSTEIQAAERSIADRLPFLVDKAFELAEGVEVQRTDNQGGVRVYTQPPDIKAITYLVDRIMGKPKQSMEVGGEGGAPMRILVVYGDEDGPDADDADGEAPEAAPGPEEDPGGAEPV